MIAIAKPLTIKEIKENADADNYIEGLIALSLSDMMASNFEDTLDKMSNALTGSPLLMDIQYRISGHLDGETIILTVSGDATDILLSK